jgi:hypothetical protein
MILVLFDPRAGKRIALDIADPRERPLTGRAGAPASSDGPEDGGERQHDEGEDQHEAEHAAAAEVITCEIFEDHGALDRVRE